MNFLKGLDVWLAPADYRTHSDTTVKILHVTQVDEKWLQHDNRHISGVIHIPRGPASPIQELCNGMFTTVGRGGKNSFNSTTAE